MRLDFHECEEKGLLRPAPPSKENAGKSIEKAKALVAEAESDYNNRTFSSCLLLSYGAMFHSARALLLKDGYREKSHACIGRYLEEKYVKAGKLEQRWVDLFDRFRDLRHTDLYDLEFRAGIREAGDSLATVKIFVERMKKRV
ncbi:HEPN domain-containing protein [Candidatus Micrarchaeota archaeon]|nr:HEPN domain-containing protein [Candidatus Micrarchaeota archaeon]